LQQLSMISRSCSDYGRRGWRNGYQSDAIFYEPEYDRVKGCIAKERTSMSSAALALQNASVLYNLADKNTSAEQIIKEYAEKHVKMDIGVGPVSLIPGVGRVGIPFAIAAQTRLIYQPMAQDLAAVYLRDTDSDTDKLANIAPVATVALEFSQEFTLEFLMEQAQELVTEVGLGILATCIPFVGVLAGGTLDYLIAQMMTWRVGTMTSIYFQNGAEWVGNRKSTMEIAKDLTGAIHVSITELMFQSGRDKAKSKDVRVDLDEIQNKVSEVRRSSVRNVLPIIKGFAA
jgi:uncharacterized protein (DUF697 family)